MYVTGKDSLNLFRYFGAIRNIVSRQTQSRGTSLPLSKTKTTAKVLPLLVESWHSCFGAVEQLNLIGEDCSELLTIQYTCSVHANRSPLIFATMVQACGSMKTRKSNIALYRSQAGLEEVVPAKLIIFVYIWPIKPFNSYSSHECISHWPWALTF